MYVFEVSFQDAEIAPETAQPSKGHMAPKAAVKEDCLPFSLELAFRVLVSSSSP